MFVDYLITVLGTTYKVPGEIDPDRSFQELEVDSLSLAELGAQLEDEFGVTVAEEDLTPSSTVADVARLLQAAGAVLPA